MAREPQLDDAGSIAQGLRTRDPGVLDVLVERHKDRLFRYLLRLTGDRQATEDLFQETWLKVVDRGDQYRASRSFLAWPLVLLAGLVNTDSKERGMSSAFWTALALLPPGIGALLYFLFRVPRPVDCTRCGKRVRPGITYCTSCGHAVGPLCPHCHREISPGDSFCPHCGRELAAR